MVSSCIYSYLQLLGPLTIVGTAMNKFGRIKSSKLGFEKKIIIVHLLQ